jgi:hypothetical protein
VELEALDPYVIDKAIKLKEASFRAAVSRQT